MAVLLWVTALSAFVCMSTQAQEDVKAMKESAEAPADGYAFEPLAADYETRRRTLLECYARADGDAYGVMASLAIGGGVARDALRRQLERIDQRPDCADFRMAGVLRLLYQFGDDPRLNEDLRQRIRRTVLDFKYWPDEPGLDSMCSWTENHQILFATAGYLAGQFYPDEIFTNSGRTGREQMAVHRPRIMRWIDLRYRTGFSEWLSNDYYNPDLAAMLNLVDFSKDEEMARRAAMVADLLLLDMALNSFHGDFASTHGRSYEEDKKHARRQRTSSAEWLAFGMGALRGGSRMAASTLALSPRYRIPRVIYEIATDLEIPELINRQRMGIRIAEAERWGLGFDNFEDGMVFLSLGAYVHPLTMDLTMKMFDAYGWWENDFFEPLRKYHGLISVLRRLDLLKPFARLVERDLARNTREEVNIYTYRTPDYMVSSAQDYRNGYGGDQQHIWQATLAPDAVCFTTHPVRTKKEGFTPSYWTGSGSLPRVAQVRNVVIAVYKISTAPGFYVTHRQRFTHAWLPRDQFDEVAEENGWIFARRGEGYLALCSQRPYRWQAKEGEDQDREVIAHGKRNIWICELGRPATDGDFRAFIDRILAAPLVFGDLTVSYHSPSQGHLEFGWTEALRQNGREVELDGYPRYDNPYVHADFPASAVSVQHKEHWLELDWPTGERSASAYLGPPPAAPN